MRTDELLTDAIDALKTAHDGAPEAWRQDHPFDREEARRQIERARQACAAADKAASMIGKAADRRDDFAKTAKALRTAEKLLAKEARVLELHDGVPIDGITIDGVSNLRAAAERAAQRNHLGRGKHGSRAETPLPSNAITLLVLLYRGITGRQETATDAQSFHDFACSCIEAFGYTLSSDRVLALIKDARPALKQIATVATTERPTKARRRARPSAH